MKNLQRVQGSKWLEIFCFSLWLKWTTVFYRVHYWLTILYIFSILNKAFKQGDTWDRNDIHARDWAYYRVQILKCPSIFHRSVVCRLTHSEKCPTFKLPIFLTFLKRKKIILYSFECFSSGSGTVFSSDEDLWSDNIMILC